MDRKIITSARLALASLLFASVVTVAGFAATPGIAAPFTGGLSPTISTSRADLDGDTDSDAADDSAAFYGDTAIINGALDCNAWILDNHGALGDGMIDADDECTLIGYDGTPDGITISVVAGEFTEAGGSPIAEGYVLPKVFNSVEPDNPSVLDSELGWSTIDGRVDSNRSETIDPEDCTLNVVGSTHVLGSDPGCGFASTIPASSDGLVDLNGDELITAADTCDRCFIGRGVVDGFVDDGLVDDAPGCTIVGTPGRDTLRGTAGPDVICGRGGRDALLGRGGRDTIKGGPGNDDMKGGPKNDTLLGGSGPDTARGGQGTDSCSSAVLQRSCER